MLDVRDEAGRSLPVLSTSENGLYAYYALAHAAELVSRRIRVPEDVARGMRDRLHAIAMEPTAGAERTLSALINSPDRGVRAIATDPLFRKLATDLARSFILLVEIERSASGRRITKFAYTTRSTGSTAGSRPLSLADRFRPLLRPTARELHFSCPNPGDSPSYHFQIDPPAGVMVTTCSLILSATQLGNGQRLTPEPVEGRVEGGVGHVHAAHLDPEDSGEVVVEVAPTSHGLVASAGVASGLILGVAITLLVLHYLGLLNVEDPERWGGSILLAVPAIAAGFLVNQSEHGLFSRLIMPIRITLVVSALFSFALAVMVAAVPAQNPLRVALWITSTVCAGCFTFLAVWWNGCRKAMRSAGVD